MPDRRLDVVQVVVDGRPLRPDLLERLALGRVEESVQLPDSFELRFEDGHFELFDEGRFAVGSTVEIAFRSEGDLVTVTTAEVTSLSLEQRGGGRHELVVRGLDLTHRLARQPKSRSFVQMTDADIAARVLADHGMRTDISPTSEVHEYVLQAGQTDLAFLAERAHRIGFDLWVAEETVHFAPRPRARTSAPTLRWGENLRKFRARFSSAERCDEVVVRGWDPVAKRAVIGRATEGERGTDAEAAERIAADARRAFGTVTRNAGQFPVTSQGEADELARSLMVKASSSECLLRGEAEGDPMLAAGTEIELTGVGDRLAGRYRITSVEHLYGVGVPYVSRFECGAKDATGLTDLVASAGSSAGAGSLGSSGRQGWGGLVVGVVTDCDDPEGLGRVRCMFPTLSDEDESTWARVASVGAGDGRGLLVTPEVGDEVIVGFEHDDRRRPVVLGGLWNREDGPPVEGGGHVSGGQVTERTFTSRSGHHLTFREDDGSTVLLHHADGHEVLLDSEGIHLTAAGGSPVVVQGQTVELTADSSLKLEAPQIEINGSAEVVVSGGVVRLN